MPHKAIRFPLILFWKSFELMPRNFLDASPLKVEK